MKSADYDEGVLAAMIAHQINNALRAIEDDPEFLELADKLAEGWRSTGIGSEAVEPVLQFMEDHPTLDFGSPGPLVHFLETFYRAGYEERLLASVTRKPVPHTVWMLNRLINGAKEPERAELISALVNVLNNPGADDETRASANEFLEFQGQ